MRTKIAILSAAALAAGLLSSQAQVYSANVVGYYNVVVPAHGYNLIANQLPSSTGNNGVQNILTSGFVSDPNGLLNSTLYFWNGAGYTVFQYFTGPDADNNFFTTGSVAGWYDSGGTLATVSLNPGKGHFLFNPTATPQTNTFVGQVFQGSTNISITPGFNTYSLVAPISTNIDSTLGNFNGTSDPNGINNDVYYYYNGAGYTTLQYFTGPDADNNFFATGSVAGFYDAGGTYQSGNASLFPKVGQGFFILHTGAIKTWAASFTVQ